MFLFVGVGLFLMMVMNRFLDSCSDRVLVVVGFTRVYVTEVPYYTDLIRVNVYDLVVGADAYSSWSGC